MALRALPLQFLNLGGEMMYIIDQRLRAQTIPSSRADKVRNDILAIMLNRRFVEELFKPQELYSRKALRTVFDKLAHASIMRLNTPSMDKLFDLMVMALKHQVLMCPQPLDLLLVTLNHLDALRSYATAPAVLAQVDATLNLFRQTYCNLSIGELADIRHSLLGFVQDLRIRVSVFLKEQQQTPSGSFVIPTSGPVPHGGEVPCVIRIFDKTGEVVNVTRFVPGGDYTPSKPFGSLAPTGPRGTLLGTNMYIAHEEDRQPPAVEHTTSANDGTASYPYQPVCPSSEEGRGGIMYGRARDELNLLAHLIGSTVASSNKEFRLHLFPADDDGEQRSEDEDDFLQSGDVITIEGSQRGGQPELRRILGELTLNEADQETDKGQDLLDLMDSA